MERFISASELCERYGLHRNTIRKWCRKGTFPRAVIKGAGGSESRWRMEDVREWESRQVSQ